MIDLLNRMNTNKQKIDIHRPMQEPPLSQLRAYYRIVLTWSSNALEGNSLTESETKVLLEDGLTVGGKPIRDYYEASGHARAYDTMWNLTDTAHPITEADILNLHRLFYVLIDEAKAGQYRQERVFITGSKHPVPSPEKVPDEMCAFIRWLAENESSVHPALFAAQAHKRFVFIHPFVNGNGRVARLLMNLCLIRSGSLAIIPPILRAEYFALLEKSHTDDTPFSRFIAERVQETQKDILGLLGA